LTSSSGDIVVQVLGTTNAGPVAVILGLDSIDDDAAVVRGFRDIAAIKKTRFIIVPSNPDLKSDILQI
jgi:hypothetical protein